MALMPWFMGLALIGVIYGALVAMIQKDMKKLVAYSSVSHLGLCMLGLFAMNPNGHHGRHPPDAQPRHLHRRPCSSWWASSTSAGTPA